MKSSLARNHHYATAAFQRAFPQCRAGRRLSSSSTSQALPEDRNLQQIFDNEAYWNRIINSPLPKKPVSSIPSIPRGKIGSQDFYHNIALKLNPFHKNATSALETGLFRNPYLTSPEGLQYFTDIMLEKAKKIVQVLETDTSDQGLKDYIKNLDTLSDILCKVIDLCEFIRISHPDPRFLKAAQNCYQQMFNYMNSLNTNVQLYLILKQLLTDPAKKHIRNQLTNEEVVVGELLLSDFQKSGIDKDDATRELFIELSSRISIYGQFFTNNTFDLKEDKIILKKKDLTESVPREILTQIFSEIGSISTKGNTIKFSVNSHIALLVLRNCANESIRKKLWVAMNTSSDDQIRALEYILNYRKILSLKLNYQDYNEYQLENKMAKNANNVLVFLKNLEQKIKPFCVAELRQLSELKLKDFEKNPKLINLQEYNDKIVDFEQKIASNTKFLDDEVILFIRPWDRDYLVNKLLISRRRKEFLPLNGSQNGIKGTENSDSTSSNSLSNQPISNFFSLGTVLSKLSKFLVNIYGVKFKFDKPLKGEIWHNDVRKLLLVNAKDENDIIGIVYLDLFERMGKSPNPAHFTIVCSRKVTSDTEIKDCEILNEKKSDAETPNIGQKQGDKNAEENVKYIQCFRNSKGEIYQLPIISIICNFSKNTKVINDNFERLSLLRLSEVETLFHEIGHSLHSMFGKTNLHNVSGTRCSSDFVELPSILMETFSKDGRVLKFLSEHYEKQFVSNNKYNGKKVSTDATAVQASGALSSLEEQFKNKLIDLHQSENEVLKYCEIYSQLKMAYLDQQLYLKTPPPVLINKDPYLQNAQNQNFSATMITTKNSDLVNVDNLDLITSSYPPQYSTKIYHDTERELKIFADTEALWHGKFGHLFTYGAIYYTYLFDRAISSKIYKDLFLGDPFNYRNGLVFRESILKWGGSRNPWECIGECLNDPRLTKGSEESMKLIGELDDVK